MPAPSHILPQECILPDLLALCPFKGSTSPYYAQAAAESAAWVDSYGAFTGRKREHFRMSRFELLAANSHPYTSLDRLRMCCDLINLLSVVDEACDDQTGNEAIQLSQSYLRALNGGSCDGSLISRITKDFRNRLENHISPTSKVMHRFLQEAANTVNAIAEETCLRERSQKLEVGEFVEFRRRNSAIFPCLALIELALGIELPDEVFEDPNLLKMRNAAADVISWTNDIYSYCREASKGIAEINIITVLMRSQRISLQEAMDHAGLLFKTQIDNFLQEKASISSFGPDTDPKVRAYIMGLEQWIIGSTNWCFDAERFFGPSTENVKKTRVVKFQQIMSQEAMRY